jgi:hypothetical protein
MVLGVGLLNGFKDWLREKCLVVDVVGFVGRSVSFDEVKRVD